MSVQEAKDYFRYCPGEERNKLSNAVCRGRRRSSYPKCKGCQFNDDEQVAPGVAAPEPVVDLAVGVSASDLVSVSEPRVPALEKLFRDSDVRGLFPLPLTTGVAWRIGYAAAQFLRSRLKGYDRADPKARSLVTGSDARSSSAAAHAALTAGIRAAGVTIYDLGVIDTPQLYFAVRHSGAGGGIVTTGGRDPFAYTGFKLCGAGARDIATATGLADIRDISRRVPQHDTGTVAPRFELNLSQPYRDFVHRLSGLSAGIARPLTVVVDASDGPAGHWAPAVFDGIDGLNLVMINDGGNEPFVHQPDPADPANLTAARRAIKAHRADFGVCFDGDADACVFLDERGVMVRPDVALALLARHLLERAGNGIVVFDHRCSRILSEEVERAGGVARRERAGSQHIKKAMAEADALIGGTLSGQIFLRDHANCESGLTALGLMVTLCAESGRRISDRVRPLLRYRASGERRVETDNPQAALQRVAEHFRDAVVERLDGVTVRAEEWWAHVGHAPEPGCISLRTEATTAELLKSRCDELEALVRAGHDG